MLMTLVAVIGMAQTSTWPITLTKADGLPGNKEPQSYVFESGVYKFDEAISTLRMTVVSTNTVDELTSGYNSAMSASWGPGFPFFSLGELTVFDANGASIEYVATSNALDHGDGGGYAALNDGKHATHFHSVYGNRGDNCPQEYHYIDLEFTNPIKEFKIKWMTRANYTLNMPTYVGLTPGTEYLPFPEQEFTLGEQATTPEELAEGGLFLIESNVEQYHHFTEGTVDRTYPGGGFFHSPYGAHVTANAASLVYLIPTGAENTYKVAWLNNGHFIINSQTDRSEWLNWTNVELAAAPIIFTPCEGEAAGDFGMTTLLEDGIERTISADAIGKMAITVTDSLAVRARPNASNFTIWKANVNANAIKFMLEEVVADAEARIAMFGYNELEDNGEYAAITAAVETAKGFLASNDATAVDVVTSRNTINELLPPYLALGIYAYTDSIDGIIEAIENEEIEISEAGNWINGSYPEGSDDALRKAADDALVAIEAYTCVADIDAVFDNIKAAIASFWASKINGVKSLPFRVGQREDGLPGPLASHNGYIWESPLYLLDEAVDALRFTVFNTSNAAKFGDYVFPTLAEFELYDIQGNKIELTEENFKTNSVNPSDGQGLAGICDNNNSTYYHGAYGTGQDPNGYTGKEGYVYIEVTLPEAISGFKYKQVGRNNAANTPTDFAFGRAGEDLTPATAMFPDEFNAVLGEKITDASQITDDGIYALAGLISCDPVNFFEGEDGPREPRFYSGINAHGGLQSVCAFNIAKTEDGKFTIQSLADGKYWSNNIDEDGWGAGSATLYKSAAAKVSIEPNNNDGLPNSFVIYWYQEDNMRDGEPHPYIIFEDWGDNIGTFSVTGLDANDKDGEGEWYIYKMTMDTPYYYWLKNLVAAAEAMGLVKSNDPGYYKELGTFPEALAAAQAAVDSKDDAKCQAAIAALNTAIAGVESVSPNPVVEGTYVFEAGQATFFEIQGVHKALYVYPNNDDAAVTSEHKLFWGDAPEGDYKDASTVYHFQLESAKESEKVQQWIADSVITAEQAETAFFIKNVYYNVYIGAQDGMSKRMGTTTEPEAVYVFRQQVPTIYDIWNPENGAWSLHMESHGNGAGKNGGLVYWYGSAEASWWRLRDVTVTTSINDIVVEGDEVVSVSYYTIDGISSNAPIKGAVNIIKTVYANGVVESKKEFIK